MAQPVLPAFPYRRRIRQGKCVYCGDQIYKIVSYPWLHTFSRHRYCTPRTSIAYKARPIKEKELMKYVLLVLHDEDKQWHIALQTDSLERVNGVVAALLKRSPKAAHKVLNMEKNR